MVEETIKSIMETESAAEEIVKKADAECAGILRKRQKKRPGSEMKRSGTQKKRQMPVCCRQKKSERKKMEDALKETQEADCIFERSSACKRRGSCSRGDRGPRLTCLADKKKPKNK